jgi:DNA gyrase/topoisomerase IV subunit B
MTKGYSSKDVRVLEEVEHIRLNPGMYIGETSNPVHLIEEALDNALDEALAGHAKIIAVIIDTKLNKFSVLDDGRGVPLEDNTPVTISSKLFSGAKFQDKKSAYEISSGLHGVGLVAVNALSTEYTVEIFRDGQHALYQFEDSKLKRTSKEKFKGDRPFSTKIEFIPNKKYFHELAPDLNRIRRRLTTASAEMSEGISFVLIIDDKKEVFQLDVETHFINSTIKDSKKIKITQLLSEKKPEKFKALITYESTGPVAPKVMSSVNLLPVDQGGSHVGSLCELLKDFFMLKGKKHGFTFQPNDALFRLRAYLSLSMIEPKFSGQTKDKLTNHKSEFKRFENDFKKQLEVFATEDEVLLLEYLERFQEYRRKLDAQKMKTNGTGGRRASTQFTKLRDCTTRTGELYIVEGDSAGGSIIQSRDPRKHAVLPLRGKSIPNVTTKKSILDNKEVGELIRAIGTGIDPQFDITKLRYDKIICATDADHDGNHIACLVTMVIGILLPELIREGRYYIAQTPLFAINEKKSFIPLWDDQSVEDARAKGRSITRFKGLGELSPHQLKICLLDEGTRNLIPIQYSENIDELVSLFSSAQEKRKLVTT